MICHHPPERFHLDLHFVHNSQNKHEIKASLIEGEEEGIGITSLESNSVTLGLYSYIVHSSPSHHWSQQEGEDEYFRAKRERNQIQIEQDHTFQFASVSSLKLWLQLLNGDDWKCLSYQNVLVALDFSFSMSNQLAGVWTMLWKEEVRYYIHTHMHMCSPTTFCAISICKKWKLMF